MFKLALEVGIGNDNTSNNVTLGFTPVAGCFRQLSHFLALNEAAPPTACENTRLPTAQSWHRPANMGQSLYFNTI